MDNLAILMHGAMGQKVPAEFAANDYDYESALRDEIKKLAGDRRAYRKNKDDLFMLLEDELDEILPARIEDAMGMFAEILQVPAGKLMEFRVKKGHTRGKQFVTRATASGVYETFRLDAERFYLEPVSIGGAGYVDFERYLGGADDIADVYEVIVEGILDNIYLMVEECLLKSWNDAGRPAANKVAANTFDAAKMQELCITVSAYGSPVIYCAPQFAATMANAITYNSVTKIADEDLTDVRNQGYIGKFHGTPVVVLPQSFLDADNTKSVINPCFAMVIPMGKEKLVKLGFEGDSIFREWNNRDNSMELQAYKNIGVGIVNTPNYWGLYYNSAIAAGGWSAFNTALVG